MGSRVQCEEYPLWSVTLRPSEQDDAHALASSLDPDDLAELALLGKEPLESLYEGIRVSRPCITLCRRGDPLAVFGLNGEVVWLLAAPGFRSLRRGLVQHAHRWVDILQGSRPIIYNAIWNRHVRRIAWLKSLGFQFGPTIPDNPDFIFFWRTKGV